MDKRLVFTILICVGIALLWQGVLFPPPRPQPRSAPRPVPVAESDAAPQPGAPAEGVPAVPGAAPAFAGPEKTHTIETPDLRAVFTTHGGALRELVLKDEKYTHTVEGKVLPVDLAHTRADQPRPLSITAGAGPMGDWEMVTADTGGVIFRSGAVEKRFVVAPAGWTITLDVTGGGEETTVLYPFAAPAGPREKGGMFAPPPDQTRPTCRVAGDTHRHSEDEDQKEVSFQGPVEWASIDQRYFIAAVLPGGTPAGKCTLVAQLDGTYRADLTVPSPGGSAKFTVYAGPKDFDTLKNVGARLEESVDFGFWALIARGLLLVMKFFHQLVGNWGVAIMLLTLAVKVVLLPLTNKSMKSMEEMKRLQPKVDEIKKKHAKDQQAANTAMMKLYQEHKVNPLGGCLPMVVQMPIWIALYTTLYTSVELYNEPFLRGWIGDLTSKDPFYVLPVAMTVTMFITQLLTPTTGQTQQMKYVMYGMPLFFGFLMLSLPSGLTLYIFTNNILSIAQQLYFKKKYGFPPVAGLPAPAR